MLNPTEVATADPPVWNGWGGGIAFPPPPGAEARAVSADAADALGRLPGAELHRYPCDGIWRRPWEVLVIALRAESRRHLRLAPCHARLSRINETLFCSLLCAEMSDRELGCGRGRSLFIFS